MSGQLDNDDDFNYLCAIQCLFKFSVSELDKAMRQWKKKKWGKSEELWLSLDKRVLGHSGRKKGGKNNSDLDSEKESISDILLRVT